MTVYRMLLVGLLYLFVGRLDAEGESLLESAPPCAPPINESMRTLVTYFSRHNVDLICKDPNHGQAIKWVVVAPRTRGVEIVMSFIAFPADDSAKLMRERMRLYSAGSVVNDSAHIAMFYPSGTCTSHDEEDCKAAFTRSATVRQKLVELFEAYTPP
jgi:hypothetical protein